MLLQLKDETLLKNKAYINGEWVDAFSGETFDVYNPATGELISKVASVGKEETRQAIMCAQTAMESWKVMPAKQRSNLMRKWYDLMMSNAEDLAKIMTLEQGKVISESRGEVLYGASFIEWFAEEAKRVYGDVIPSPFQDRRQIVIKQPVGVVAAVTPWNFPNAMITRKAGPALAAGCSFVIKPASETPLSALALAELSRRAGIPAGVFNVLPGKNAAAIGNELTENPIVRKFTFTGSTIIGKKLLEKCASTVKKVSMELGGNAPVIVFEDADIDKAVAGTLASKYRNSGQTCICVNRILVQESICEVFTQKLVAAVNQFKVGNGMDETVNLGPLVNAQAVQNVDALVTDAISKGATKLSGGKRDSQEGCFYEPTVLSGITKEMRIANEEIFGPVATIFTFKDESEAIRMANDTEFGLASYVYTKDLARAWRVSVGIDFGMVGVNEVGITNDAIPFGGQKESGLGREGSKYGIDEYLEVKYICMGGI